MILFKNVSKEFPGGIKAVSGLSFEIPENEILVLLGTSGSGKTTALKMINRLEEPTEGRIYINGKPVDEMDPIKLRLSIGYAIQEVGLFPHMTVAENISVVPELLKWEKGAVHNRIDELLSMVGLDPGQTRSSYPHTLSGGQKQRVGVARALASDPPVILMDEPFGALDPITREQLQDEFLELIRGMNKTVVFVTHDVFEAVKIGNMIAILDKGILQQIDTPAGIVDNPANEFVERFLGRHHFQLSMVTGRMKNYFDRLGPAETQQGGKPEAYLTGDDSLESVLELFRKTGKDRLPVYNGKEYRGVLNIMQVFDILSDFTGKRGKE